MPGKLGVTIDRPRSTDRDRRGSKVAIIGSECVMLRTFAFDLLATQKVVHILKKRKERTMKRFIYIGSFVVILLVFGTVRLAAAADSTGTVTIQTTSVAAGVAFCDATARPATGPASKDAVQTRVKMVCFMVLSPESL